ncbi:hypothetical protein CMV_009983 [Castanea mollissima]|uniref:Uncharacterized protein n=1 Tax=Castanea mollissima TaxID=60419 RepID=A0A8J4VQD6_9ROSI|nr:hypothetical protein CMV_009983 [Castanea mollissima]
MLLTAAHEKIKISFSIVIPGCEILKWFTHQSVGHIDSNEVSHSSLSHSSSAAPEVVASSGKIVCEVDSHSSLSRSWSVAPDVVASSGRTIVRKSFYWTSFLITGGTFLFIHPQIACSTSRVHGSETV